MRSTRARQCALWLASVFALGAIAGCGGGSNSSSGGGSNNSSTANLAPTVSGVELSLDSVEFMTGNGRTPVQVTARFTDPESDTVTLHVQLSDGSTPAVTLPAFGVLQAGATVGQFDHATDKAGPSTVQVWVVDRAGNASNRMNATLTVRGSTKLSALELSGAPLDQPFAPDTKQYTAAVDFGIASVGVTATTLELAATVRINGAPAPGGNWSANLIVGDNTVAIEVTGSDGVAATYTVKVRRRANARLSALSFSAGTFDQVFQPALTTYTATVGLLRPTTTVTATAADATATIIVKGQAVASGTPSRKLTLAQGHNALDVVVTAIDGTKATYSIDVTRRTAQALAQEIYIKSDDPEGTPVGFGGIDARPSHFGASLAFDGRRLAVGAWGEDSGGARDGGVLYLYTRDDVGTWRKEARLGTPSTWNANTNPEPHFGANVALSGTSMFVAEVWSREGWPIHAPVLEGRVHVYARQSDQWVLAQTLWPTPRPQLWSRFGMALAARHDMLVVGDSSGAQVQLVPGGLVPATEAYGAVSVFAPGANGWVQTQYLTSPAPDIDDAFGIAVALDGDVLAIGAPGEDSAPNGITADPNDDSMADAGAVFVLRRQAGAWVPDTMLKAPNADAGDRFGSAVAVSGSTLVVSAPSEDSGTVGVDGDSADDGATNSGAVYVFARDAGGVWRLEAYIKASNTDAGDGFGGPSLALTDDVLLVGASFEDGGSLGVNGDQSSDSAEDAGAVYAFTRDADRHWSQVAYLKASNTSWQDNFGTVVFDRDVIVIGAAGESSTGVGLNGAQSHDPIYTGMGAVYVFR